MKENICLCRPYRCSSSRKESSWKYPFSGKIDGASSMEEVKMKSGVACFISAAKDLLINIKIFQVKFHS